MTREEIARMVQKDPVLNKTLETILSEQWKFSAEPVLAKTGKGFLRSAGVSEIAAAKAEDQKEVDRALLPGPPICALSQF